jgi:tetratricopeptide (TPR) repeat protein
MGNYMKQIEDSRNQIPDVANLRAIYLLVKEHDADQAIILLKKLKMDNDGLWHYNLAFLYSYKGDLKTAIRHYRKAITLGVEPWIIATIEEFITWILQQEPKKYQLYYSLGFFNWKAKGDKIQAQKDFRGFLKAADKNQFSKEIELANKWLDEIKKTGK